MQTGYWRTGEGEKIRICDMDNRHLINTIRYLEKETKGKTPFEDHVRPEYWLFLEELNDRIRKEKIVGFTIMGNRVYLKRNE